MNKLSHGETISDWTDLNTIFDRIPNEYTEDSPAWQEAAGAEVDVIGAYAEGDREDLTGLDTFTVDPEDARDFDDALSIEDNGDGYTMYVHIADVSNYIESGSALDQAASRRGNTFYLDAEEDADGEPIYHTIHMLPENLSTDVCSLRPEEDRLAHTFEMELDEEYTIQDFDQYKSIIHSDRRFTYDEADDSLEFGGEFADALQQLDEVTQQWRDERYDSSLLINPEDSASSRIIEEAMVNTNHQTGQYLQQEGLTGIYRVEDRPQERWREDIVSDLRDIGHNVPDNWLHDQPLETLNDFIGDLDQDDVGDEIFAIVTKMTRAQYDRESTHHFALGISEYSHVTSPIRRAADLFNHQVLSAHLDMEGDYDELLSLVDPEELLDQSELSYHEGVLAQKGRRRTDDDDWHAAAAKFDRQAEDFAYRINMQEEEAKAASRAWDPATPD